VEGNFCSFVFVDDMCLGEGEVWPEGRGGVVLHWRVNCRLKQFPCWWVMPCVGLQCCAVQLEIMLILKILVLLGAVWGWTQNCCDVMINKDEFISCVTLNSKNIDENNKKVTIAMFASNNTMSYAPFTILINSYYCNIKNYEFRLFTDENTPFSHHDDKRWNKIGIVMDAFSANGWGKDLEYLVVIDADLIVTDFSLDIGTIASSYPNSHLLMSKDAADIANSGFLIVKRSDWVFNFFSLWWEKRLTSSTDQFAFNELYHRLGEPDEIALLPPSEINSEYPVYKTFSPQSRVLHMFGEIDEIRTEVFRFASSELCRHVSAPTSSKKRRGPKRYPPQLGLSAAKLREIAFEQVSLRRDRIKSQLITCGSGQLECSDEDQLLLIERLQSETSSLCGFGRGILADENQEECLSMALDNCDIIRPFTIAFSNDSLAYLDYLAQNLYAAFTWSGDSLESIAMGEEVPLLLLLSFSFLSDVITGRSYPKSNDERSSSRTIGLSPEHHVC
jgi:hypothetical protein